MDATVTVTGNVGSDVDLRTDGSNEWAYAAFRLACTPRVLRQGAWRDGETTWLNVNCRNRGLSLNVEASVHKGDPVIVTGRLTTWSWTNTETGEVQDRLVLDATAIGHDLTRGSAQFKRAERPASEPPGDDPRVFDRVGAAGEDHARTSDNPAEQAEQAPVGGRRAGGARSRTGHDRAAA